LVKIKDFSSPTTVEPGQRFSVSFGVKNNAVVILPGDPDRCLAGNVGYSLEGTMNVGGSTISRSEICAGALETNRMILTGNAPREPGTYRATVQLRGTGSGTLSEEESFPLEVTDPDGGGGGGGGPGGGDPGDGGGGGDPGGGGPGDGGGGGDPGGGGPGDGGGGDQSGQTLTEWWQSRSSGEQIALVAGGAGALYLLSNRGGGSRGTRR
jgi:hypothetical protein